MTEPRPHFSGVPRLQRTSAEYALLETIQRTRAALLEQTQLGPDELRERLYAAMHDEVELYQRRAAAANDPLLADPADTEQWLEDQVLGYAVHLNGISGGGTRRARLISVSVADWILGGPGGFSRFLRG